MEKLSSLTIEQKKVLDSLSCLEESLYALNYDESLSRNYKLFRNSAIQCFEFSLDTLWKFLKKYLAYEHKIILTAPTPRAIFLETWKVAIIHDKEIEIFFDMIEDRNITSHTYNEALAEEIKNRLQHYLEVMRLVLSRISLPE